MILQEAARAQAAQHRAHQAELRQADRLQRAYQKAQAAEERERKRLYAEARATEAANKNNALERAVDDLQNILNSTLSVDDFLDFECLKEPEVAPRFDPGDLGNPIEMPDKADFDVSPLAPALRLLSSAKRKHAAKVELAERKYAQAVRERDTREDVRLTALSAAKKEHEQKSAELLRQIRERNNEVEEFKAQVDDGNPEAVVDYFGLVLSTSKYPLSFPRHHRMAYVPESKQLVCEIQLPNIDVVPDVKVYRYVKARDEIATTARPVSQIKALYSSVLSQIAVRTLHELFEADRMGLIETVVLNGFVDSIDPATGQKVRPTLVTVRTTKEQFGEIDLANVEPLACLKHLGAGVSRSPKDLTPVRPVLEFEMVDHRYVEETDVLSALDDRPNLMALSPNDFENLITNLFSKMGLDTRQTRPSRDGGVDCVAYDNRPIFGGKVVIQAKRYKGTVGVSAVRDLYGTVHNEGATKGILVTTSGYGASSFEFANGKPLELIDGAGLLYLLAENAGIEARIVPPDDWVDPSSAELA